jgi:dipeptide transport system permease protein
MSNLQNTLPTESARPAAALALREFWANFAQSRRGRRRPLARADPGRALRAADRAAARSSNTATYVLIPPAWLAGGNWQFILGTDEAGRDILSRLMFGAACRSGSASCRSCSR